jgi:class 3 adenylate cyclase
MFCDIQGFTAWSSARNPSQVFTLLETIYGAFDAIARKRRVFKVETIGDCYVAVTGLPDPREDHAVVMARFARDCKDSMNELTRRLESTLGPETGDLKVSALFPRRLFFRFDDGLSHPMPSLRNRSFVLA